MNTVALSPGNGSQPAGEARSSRLTSLAAPIPKSVPVVLPVSRTLAARVSDESAAPFPTPQASSPSFRATQASSAGDCVPPLSLTRPALLGASGGEASIPSEDDGGAKMDGCNHPGRGPSGLIRSAKSSQAATDIDPAFFAAWRESQGTTIDAEPRASR